MSRARGIGWRRFHWEFAQRTPAFGRARRKKAVRALLLAPLTVYRRLVSPLLPQRCRFYPTCSTYADQAVREFGILRGLLLAGWRILRCNPWNKGGLDPLEDQRLFRPRRGAPPS